MQTQNMFSYTSAVPVVARLERELTRLKALLGWQVAVRRGKKDATRSRRLTPEKIMAALYETRYPLRPRRS